MLSFNATNNQRVDLGTNEKFAPNLLTACMWIDFRNVTTQRRVVQNFYLLSIPPTPSDRSWAVFVQSGKIIFQALCTSSPYAGSWEAAITTGKHHIAITMDFSSVSNNPTIYVDGSSVTVTETSTPAGSFPSGATNVYFSLGDIYTGDSITALDGDIYSFTINNVILTSGEIASAYSSRLAIPTLRGLTVAPLLCGVVGGADDGDTLSTSNYIKDFVNGANGVPYSTVFYADTYLNWR